MSRRSCKTQRTSNSNNFRPFVVLHTTRWNEPAQYCSARTTCTGVSVPLISNLFRMLLSIAISTDVGFGYRSAGKVVGKAVALTSHSPINCQCLCRRRILYSRSLTVSGGFSSPELRTGLLYLSRAESMRGFSLLGSALWEYSLVLTSCDGISKKLCSSRPVSCSGRHTSGDQSFGLGDFPVTWRGVGDIVSMTWRTTGSVSHVR